MSNLQISTADIPFHATRIIEVEPTTDFANKYNLVGGKRSSRCKLTTAAASQAYTFDLGAGFASKNGTVDHVILGRADLADVNTIVVQGGTDGSTWSVTPFNITSISSYFGPRSQDYIETVALSSAYRYWKITLIKSVGTSIFQLSKLQIGAFLNFTIDPNFVITPPSVDVPLWNTTSGAGLMTRNKEAAYKFRFEWPHQTNAVVTAFQDRIVRYADKTNFWLYTNAEHQILDSMRLINAELTEFSHEKESPTLNTIFAEFSEVIG